MTFLLVVAIAVSSAGCGLPASYSPGANERFWAMVVAERWTRDDAEIGAATSKVNTHSIPAVTTWRLGADAPLPRAVRINDECLAFEGSWADTDFSHPSFGAVTFTFDDRAPQALSRNRTEDGHEWMNAEGWTAGSHVTMRGAGAAIPAFEKSGIAPAEPKLTTWDMPSLRMGELRVSTGQALTVDWVPQDTQVLLLILQFKKHTTTYHHGVWCTFPGRRGTGTVPLEVMQRLDKQADIAFGNLYFASVALERWTDGNTDFEWANWNGRCARVTWE